MGNHQVDIADVLSEIDETLKDESDAIARHDQLHTKIYHDDRTQFEDVLLSLTPNNLSDVANLLMAISEMLSRAERHDLAEAISAIGQRMHREQLH
jgi:hypothetical protein